MNLRDLVTSDIEILGGQNVFKGTRVPVESFFGHLEAGVSLDKFVESFPTVSRDQAIALLEWTNRLLNTKNLEQIYESVA